MRTFPWMGRAVCGLLVSGVLYSSPLYSQNSQTFESQGTTESRVREFLFPLEKTNIEGIKGIGQPAIPILIKLYETSDVKTKTSIAWVFYSLGWVSPEAKAVLMKDVHTSESGLRLQVQWALGRVSKDPDVVETLLKNMRTDPNPLFRDKAACALASDQIHLSEKEKFRLYEGLIEALSDSNDQVRSIAIQALRIQTGQDKGYNPGAPEAQRQERIKQWQEWLKKYREQL